jgi:hypothetical protein
MSDETPVDDIGVDPAAEGAAEAPEATQTEAEVVEAARIRAIAEAQGWRPEGKLDPVDFLEAIPRYSEGLVNKLRAAEDKIERLSRAVGQQISAADAEAKARAEVQFQEATERGDVEAARRAAAELHKPAPVLEDTPTDAQSKVKAWTEQPEQHWFRDNAEMAADAAAMYDAEMRRLGRDDPDQILPVVNNKIRKLHAEKFTNPNRQLGSAATTTGASRTTQQASRRAVSAEGLIDPAIRAQYLRLGLTDAEIVKSLEMSKRVY